MTTPICNKYSDTLQAQLAEELAAIDEQQEGQLTNVTASLYKVEQERAVERLICMLEHQNNRTKAGAILELGLLGDYYIGWEAIRPAVKPLIVLLNDGNDEVREHATWLLRCLRDERAFEPLLALAQDSNEEVRAEAITGIAWISKTGAWEYLVVALNDQSMLVRFSAVHALTYWGDERSLDALAIVEQDDIDRQVRDAAAEAITAIRKRGLAPQV